MDVKVSQVSVRKSVEYIEVRGKTGVNEFRCENAWRGE